MSELNYKGLPHQLGHTADYIALFGGSEYPILGDSNDIVRIKRQMEFASKIDLPIFISGAPGTEKRSIAYTIHMQRGKSPESFIYVPANIQEPSRYKAFIEQAMQTATQGTLFIADIDILSEAHQSILLQCLTLSTFQCQLLQQSIHLIISSSCGSGISNIRFISKLFGSGVPHLEISIPALKLRRRDIRTHIDYILQHRVPNMTHQLSDDAYQLFSNQEWPENIDQLQRVLVSLVSSLPSGVVTTNEIIQSGLLDVEEPETRDLIDQIIDADFSDSACIHPGLLKALRYISQNFTGEMTLTSVANSSYVSASHLSYLFRQSLGRSFKGILVEVRVRYAKKLIQDKPMTKITEVCLQSGFGDLSHFEKMFRRFEHMTPREFRQHQRQAQAI